MRISDWSSDVCSSDLGLRLRAALPAAPAAVRPPSVVAAPAAGIEAQPALPRAGGGGDGGMSGATAGGLRIRHITKHFRLGGLFTGPRPLRPAERRVGKERVSPSSSGCSPCH